MTISDEEDRPTIADLEVYGLPLVVINLLEEKAGLIYVDDLKGVSREALLDSCRQMAGGRLEMLVSALRRYLEGGPPVRTEEECVRI